MTRRLPLVLLLLAGIAGAAVTGSTTNGAIDRPAFEAIEGTTLQLTLDKFTREDKVTPVTPLAVAYRLDCPPASGSLSGAATPMVATQALTPASTVVTRIPAHKVTYCAADAILSVTYEWLPGSCSSSIATSCSANGDCPGGETCRRSVGHREATVRISKRRFSN